jgi:hypothetical protein
VPDRRRTSCRGGEAAAVEPTRAPCPAAAPRGAEQKRTPMTVSADPIIDPSGCQRSAPRLRQSVRRRSFERNPAMMRSRRSNNDAGGCSAGTGVGERSDLGPSER